MFNEESVCKKCHNENNDKAECALVCKRREAYALHQPWYHIPPYGEIMEQKEEVTIPAPMDEYQKKYTEPVREVAAMKKPVKKQPVEEVEITLEVRQAKTWQEKYEYCQSTQKCLHCGKPKSKTNTLQAGLCKRICSNRWRRNTIRHPIYGEFLSQEQIKMNWSEETTQKIAAKKTRNHGISDEALRNVEPSLEAAVKRIEARKETKKPYSPEELHTVSEILNETARHINARTPERIITIDMAKYDTLYEKIMQESERDYVPIFHTIINLLSIGMQVVEGNIKNNMGGERWKYKLTKTGKLRHDR